VLSIDEYSADDSEVIGVHACKLTDALIMGKNHGQIDAVTIIANQYSVFTDREGQLINDFFVNRKSFTRFRNRVD
jgi:catalase (peroxidase I)